MPAGQDPAQLLERASRGDRGALARALSMVERGGDAARQVARCAHRRSGGAYTVGLTGSPGAGKSTLTNSLCRVIRADVERVAVLAIDPSSPFSGGAILGDRVRMGEASEDPGVYIRSMATRGHLGGLALATPEAVRVLDAAGFGWIVVETVGVGQVEVDIATAADTTVVVLNPGWGDAVQANKAGLLEIADVFVINKADRPGAGETRRDLESMLALGSGSRRPEIVETIATANSGVDELWAAICRHRAGIEASGELAVRRVERSHDEVRAIVMARVVERVDGLLADGGGASLRSRLQDGSSDPWEIADELLAP